MGFKMLDTLALESAENENVMLVPTKKYFKPVLVLTAPLTPENAGLVGAGWAFDEAGNPQSFEGSIKLLIELPRATVTVAGKVTGEVRIVSEVVKHFTVFRQEKVGMRIRLRIHLPEDRSQLLQLLDFLSDLNADPFAVTVQPDSLFTASGGEQPRNGSAPIVKSMNIRKGRKTLMVGELRTQPVDGGYVGGWEIKAVALLNSPADGETISNDSQVFSREPDALVFAGERFLNCLKYTLKPDSLDEVKAVGEATDWLLEQVPSLRKDPPASDQKSAVH